MLYRERVYWDRFSSLLDGSVNDCSHKNILKILYLKRAWAIRWHTLLDHYHVFKLFYTKYGNKVLPRNIMSYADYDFKSFKFLFDNNSNFYSNRLDIIGMFVINQGDVKALKYLTKYGLILDNETLTYIVSSGKVKIYRYVKSIGHIFTDHDKSLKYAITHRHVSMVRELVKEIPHIDDEILKETTKANNMDITDIILTHAKKYKSC